MGQACNHFQSLFVSRHHDENAAKVVPERPFVQVGRGHQLIERERVGLVGELKKGAPRKVRLAAEQGVEPL